DVIFFSASETERTASNSFAKISSTCSATRSLTGRPARMKSSLSIWSSSTQSGSQKLAMLRISIGFLCRPSWAQVSCSTSSSSLPPPPRSAPYAAAREVRGAERRGEEGGGGLEHRRLALGHVGRDHPLLHAQQHVLAIDQKVRDDPGDGAAVIEDRFGERSHQADRPAAIDQADAVLGQNAAELCRRVHESWVLAGTGCAIDANRFYCAHGQWVGPTGGRASGGGLGMAVSRRFQLKRAGAANLRSFPPPLSRR